VEALATDRIGCGLAAVDELLRSIAPQTTMNGHSELKLDALRNIQPMELGVKQMCQAAVELVSSTIRATAVLIAGLPGRQPAGDISHKPQGLPFSARPTVTFPASDHHHPWPIPLFGEQRNIGMTDLPKLLYDSRRTEQTELVTSRSLVQHLLCHHTTLSFISDIAVFVLKRHVKLQPTNQPTPRSLFITIDIFVNEHILASHLPKV